MSNDSFKRAVNSLLEFQNTLEPKHEVISAITGHPNGDVSVTNMANYIYCRLQADDNKVVRAFNTVVPNNVADLAVDLDIIKDEQGRIIGYAVLGVSRSIQYIVAPPNTVPIAGVGAHHQTHEAARQGGGYDMVNVYEEAIVTLRGNAQSPASLKINIARGAYYIDGTRYYYAGGESPTFTVDGDSIDVVCIDDTGTLSIVEGTHGSWGGGAGGFSAGGSTPTFPSIPTGKIPLAAVNIVSTLTEIAESNFGSDPRPFIANTDNFNGVLELSLMLMGG